MKKHIGIHIGDFHASKEPAVIQTLVGSCVAVCLYDSVNRVGGMNHILLPGKADMRCFDEPARYGINAMELLINRMLALGADRRRLTAKAFGGAHILPGISSENNPGRKNIEFVAAFLEMESIPLVGYDLGGDQGRQVRFHTRAGKVFVKRTLSSFMGSICSKELQAMSGVSRKSKKPGGIMLFTEKFDKS